MHPLVIVAPTEAQAREMLAAKSVRYFGLLFPDEVWQLFGLAHPMGEGFQGYLDLIPEAYDRQTIDAAIDAVPSGMIEGLMWGTPEQVASKLQAYGEAGLRHVVPVFLSATVSQEAATFSVQALGEIAQQLRDGR
jgi:phthiodiolone/phenolphthiodiolone dimycocerosates ketoreductase